MAGMGRYPKPVGERHDKSSVGSFDWVMLPAEGRVGPAPKLPSKPIVAGPGVWSKSTKDWWADLWRSPQAVVWDQSGRTLFRLALLHELLDAGGVAVAGLASEMRQIEDRHGLSPKSLLQLRWRIVEAGDVVQLPVVSKRRGQLKVVDGLA